MTGVDNGDHNQQTLQSRLLWFRGDHPDADIETEMVVMEEEMAVCRATLRSQSGGSASSHGSALRELAGERYAEVAEDRALARALIALGYGESIPGIDVGDSEERAAPLPPIELRPARALVHEETESNDDEEPQPAPQPIREARPAVDAGADDGADVNWTKFWTWARRRGYRDANQLSELLSVDVLAHTPREVRQMLAQYELDHPPGGEDE